MTVQFLVAFVATLAFAVLFAVPPKRYVLCALGGAVCWVVYLGITRAGGGVALASFLATLVLMLFSRFAGNIARAPVIIFITTGIFPLVPGAAIYHTAYSLFLGNLPAAVRFGMETLVSAGTIALGMLVGYSLPGVLFEKAGNACRTLAKRAKAKK